MKRVNVYAAVREMREQIVKTMQERGIKEMQMFLSYQEWGKEQKYSADDYAEDEDDDTDYFDYKDSEAPYVIFFGKYGTANDYRVDKVKLKTFDDSDPVLEFDCYNNELGSDTFGEDDLVFLTLYNVYDNMYNLLKIGDEEEKLMVLCSYDSDEQEYDDHLIVSKQVFYSEDGKKKIRKYLNEAFEYNNMEDYDRKEFRECVKNLLKGGVGYFGIKYFWEETTAIL